MSERDIAFLRQFLVNDPTGGFKWKADVTVVATVGSVEVSNDSGNPIPVSKDTSPNSALNPLFVSSSPSLPSTGTFTPVASAIASTTILAANVNRKGASFFNDSTATLYLRNSAGAASSANFSVKVPPDSYFEMPFGYTGIVVGIWSAVNGSVKVTEFT
jgi:hypothetical protein